MIKYLIKFSEKKEYAEELCAGKLFMNTLSAYRKLDIGQGDPCEGNVFPDAMISSNLDFPVYCMYAVMDSQIQDGKIIVLKKCINDFRCENGYATIIKFPEFEEKIQKLNTDGYQLLGGLVEYKKITEDDVEKLWEPDNIDNVFIKQPYFRYQHEFRLLVRKKVISPPVRYSIEGGIKDIHKQLVSIHAIIMKAIIISCYLII